MPKAIFLLFLDESSYSYNQILLSHLLQSYDEVMIPHLVFYDKLFRNWLNQVYKTFYKFINVSSCNLLTFMKHDSEPATVLGTEALQVFVNQYSGQHDTR